MGDIADRVHELELDDVVDLADPAVGETRVIVSDPRETTTLSSGEIHFVFAHRGGRMIGLNWAPPDDGGWDACVVVVDSDGYQHALLSRSDQEVRLLTRREPGQPDDWEDRGVVRQLDVVETHDSPRR